MVELNLLSTLLMGLLVAAVFAAVTRIGTQREPPRAESGEQHFVETFATEASGFLRTPAVWMIGFVILAIGVGLAAVAAFGDLGTPESLVGPLLGVVVVAIAALLIGFVFFGTYSAIRSRGLGNAQGVAAGSLVTGLVFLFVIALRLVFDL